MGKKLNMACRLLLAAAVLLLAAGFIRVPEAARAEQYTREAVLKDSANYPGVYYAKAVKDDSGATLGIPSIAKQNLEDHPTTETPAIVMGAAVPHEERVGFTEFRKLSGGSLYPPYSYFRYSIIEEANPNGASGTHRKMSGFDGSYVIIRVDVSELVQGAEEGSFLHVKQAGNKALMASLLHEPMSAETGRATFSDALGNKVGVYSLANGAASLKDREGGDADTPYIDLVVFSSGTHVAGADTGSTDPNVIGADFTLSMYVDKTGDYNPDLVYDPNAASPTDPNAPTMEQQMLAKYFDDKAEGATSYKVKGSDLELETRTILSGTRQFWSLRKSLAYQSYNRVPISLICEVPVLEGLTVEGSAGSDRYVIFDVNSFDIQIANHQTTGSAALTVKNATLEITDGFETTGAELAVGNNATMAIKKGGTLIVAEKCQLEVEYDAASVAPDSTTAAPDLSVGVLTIEDGGTIINRGVITVEGTEGKPIDPAAPSQRDIKDAEFHIQQGGTLINEGCLLSYGALYNSGTIENYGQYSKTITSQDPDKGTFTYHRGIQISWKDDVTQDSVVMGHLYNGGDAAGATDTGARIVNQGDIVLVPGYMENWGTVENGEGANIFLCAVKEAVIPIVATVDKPLITEKRIAFKQPISSFWMNHQEGTLINEGGIAAADVKIVNNGRTGDLTALTEGDLFESIELDNFGQITNGGSVTLDSLMNFGAMTNEGSGTVDNKVVLAANTEQAGTLTDRADPKLDNVYNGALTADGDTNLWAHAVCGSFTVSPSVQYNSGEETVDWTVLAETAVPAEGVRYLVELYEATGLKFAAEYTISANEENTLTSPQLPRINQNVVYSFYISDGTQSLSQNATVKVTSSTVTPPAPIPDLVYDGTEQVLTTTGCMEGTMLYRLGEDGEWSETVPAAKDAGSYDVYYKLQEEPEDGTGSAFVTAVIAKRSAAVSADDTAGMVGAPQKELTWTVSGLVEGETIDGNDVSVTTEADLTAVGEYPITVALSGDYPNYEFTLRDGVYTVTETEFNVIAKDKYGVFSDDAAYKGFNIELTAPEGAKVFYSTSVELTPENHETQGQNPLVNLPAGAGVHTVYFYVTDGTNTVRGSKQVIIEKAKQTAPDKLEVQSETWLNSGDGIISGLTPRAMEYRNVNNDGTYTLIYEEQIYVAPGTYLVRKAADDNHYPSPDAVVTVEPGEPISVTFDSNGGSAVDGVTGLACGDLVASPSEDPVLPGAQFLGWYRNGVPYDFSAPVTLSMTITAGWAPEAPWAVELPDEAKIVEESAFEGDVSIESVSIPYGCTAIEAAAFKGCTALTQIQIPASVTALDETAFDGCGSVYVFGLNGTAEDRNTPSAAQLFCEAHDGFTFVADVQ
ncbi:MAG: leucine-rich repeat protein [Clostridia bacterium]|nr:leucine-rich repeat protein [Clostridia bacterium]